MAVAATIQAVLTLVETITQGFPNPSDSTVTFDQLNQLLSLNASSSVPVTKLASFSKALGGGTGTIDLTSMPGNTPDETVTFLNLRVQAWLLLNPSTNANAITIVKGASNGWTGAGATFALTLQPGQWNLAYFDEDGPDVAAGVKTLDLTGTGTQTLSVQLAAG
jgi:hypothetical protein